MRLANPAAEAAAQTSKMQNVDLATMIAGGAVLAGTALWGYGVARDAWACYETPLDKIEKVGKGLLAKTKHAGQSLLAKTSHAEHQLENAAAGVGKKIKKGGAWKTVSGWFKKK